MGDYISVGVVTPLLIAAAFSLPLITLVTKRREIYYGISLAVSAVALALTIYNFHLVFNVIKRPLVYTFGGWPPPIGIVYEVDALSALLGLVTGGVMFTVTLYSVWYLRDVEGYEWYFTLLLGLEAGLLGCLYTGDVFNLFVMLEVLSVSAYALVAFYRSSKEAVEAGIKYAIIGALSTTIYFIALVFIYGAFGTLNMADLAAKSRLLLQYTAFFAVPLPPSNLFLATAIALPLSLWAFLFKAAVFPNHFWLPDAHPAAPTPISAALSGLVVNVGAYATIRFLYTIFGYGAVGDIAVVTSALSTGIVILGAVSAVVGSVMMMIQKDIKRLIAYSTILHLGLIFSAIGLRTAPALSAALYHITTHSVGKALLFMSAGVFIKAVRSRSVDDMAGVARYLLVSSIAMMVSIMSLIGLPPLGGFFSKLSLYTAYLHSNHPYLVAVLLASSTFALLAYIKVLYVSWFRYPTREVRIPKEGVGITLPFSILVITLMVLGFLSPLLMQQVFNYASINTIDYSAYVGEAHKYLLDLLLKLRGG